MRSRAREYTGGQHAGVVRLGGDTESGGVTWVQVVVGNYSIIRGGAGNSWVGTRLRRGMTAHREEGEDDR